MKKIINIIVCICFILSTMGCGSLIREGNLKESSKWASTEPIDDRMTCYNFQQEIDKLHYQRLQNMEMYNDIYTYNVFCLILPPILFLYDVSPSRYLKANKTLTKKIEDIANYGNESGCNLTIPEELKIKKIKEEDR